MPLFCSICGAENGTRTRDPNLGKVVLYQLSYFRVSAKLGFPATPRQKTNLFALSLRGNSACFGHLSRLRVQR